MAKTKHMGKVYLVGAGPGDPGLITLKGARLISEADVLIYDHLVDRAILAHAGPGAEMVYVGKTAGKHTLPQKKINRLLSSYARKGHVVVRLKGGDPFVFGRGGEEALELERLGIPFEVVPGITSAIGAPAYAGIPVTFRGITSCFGVITGHEDPLKPRSDLDWKKISTGFGTLVFLMGVKNLKKIADCLVKNGRRKDTPVVLIRWGTTPHQQVLIGTLADIADKAKAANLGPPAIILVGDVVGLRDRLNWFETRPLFGKRIVVTRSRKQASALAESLTGKGAEVIELPTIRIVPMRDFRSLDRALGRLRTFDWIIFIGPSTGSSLRASTESRSSSTGFS
jgi:uroporphyrinogen III methyltransferase/synthase